MLNLIAPTVT